MQADSILEINRDITAQLHAEDALRRTERLAAMGRVAGIIAHEINNPLEAITNTFFLLRNHPSLDEEARYFARLGEEAVKSLPHHQADAWFLSGVTAPRKCLHCRITMTCLSYKRAVYR